MTLQNLKELCLAALFGVSLPVAAHAADVAAPVDSNDWTFTTAAYLWGASLDGKSGVFGLPPQELELSFGDVLEDLQFAVMGLAEARKGPFMLGMDLTYTKVSSTIDSPRGIIFDDVSVDTTSWMVTGIAGYSIFDNDVARLDLVGGARLWSVNSEFALDSKLQRLDGRTAEDGASWADPLMGAKLLLDLTPDLYISAWGMVGGFGIGSDEMWDVMAGAGYRFNDTFSVFGGYRAVSVDYSDDGFVYDVVQQGPVVAGVFRF